MRTLLIAGIDSAAGAGLLQCLGSERAALRIVGIASRADAAANFLCDAVYWVPPEIAGESRVERFRAIIRNERPDLVLAGTDAEVAPLAALKAEAGTGGALVHLPGPQAAALLADRHAVSDFGRRLGLPFVESAVDARGLDGLVSRHGFPLIARQRSVDGMAGVHAVASRREADAWLDSGGVVLQPFIGEPTGVAEWESQSQRGMPLFALAKWHFATAASLSVGGGAVVFQGAVDIEVRSRLVTRCTRADASEIEAPARSFAAALAALDFTGPLSVLGRRGRDGHFRFFGAEGRVADTVRARALLGVDDLGEVREILGLAPLPPVASPGSGVQPVERVLGWSRIGLADHARLREEGVWRSTAPGPHAAGSGAGQWRRCRRTRP